MPELARGEFEHIFEPWFPKEPASPPAGPLDDRGATSLFARASEPLAVSRHSYIRRQSPIARTLEAQTSTVVDQVERLAAFVERRHLGVERPLAPHTEQRAMRFAILPSAPTPAARPSSLALGDTYVAKPGQVSPFDGGGALRAAIGVGALLLVGFYLVQMQRSTALATSRAEAAERATADVRRESEAAIAAASDRSERAITAAVSDAARAQRMIEVIAAPDARRFDLLGRTAAPSAVGQAVYSRSRGVLVSAADMPAPSEGHVFRVWARTSAGIVALGSATPDAHGRMALTFDLPDNSSAPIYGFLITQEPVDGGTVPQGPTALSN